MDFVQDNRIPPHGSYATTQKKKLKPFGVPHYVKRNYSQTYCKIIHVFYTIL